MTTTVYKVGGSLLDLPDLSHRLERLLSEQVDDRPLLAVGGGGAADIVRRWDDVHNLGEESAHWLALRSLMLNEALLLNLLRKSRLVFNRADAETSWTAAEWPILSAYEFLRNEDPDTPAEARLPHRWDVTSDSVAAWIALRWPADRLVLLKSTPLPEESRCEGKMSTESVDIYFCQLAPRLREVFWVDLRAEEPMLHIWR